MEGSKKNRLQEYYQRRQLLLPVYTHERTESGDWKSTLTLVDGRRFFGIERTKKDADQNAAAEALAALECSSECSRETPSKPDWRLAGCVLVLIDLENSPGYDNTKWSNIRWDCSKIEAFVGKLSSHATKDLASLYPFVQEFHVVNSSMRDAVDHAISVRAGKWLESMKHIEYYIDGPEGCVYDDAIHIVSRDRFAGALSDVLNQGVPPPFRPGTHKPQVVHSVNIDDCFELLAKSASTGVP